MNRNMCYSYYAYLKKSIYMSRLHRKITRTHTEKGGKKSQNSTHLPTYLLTNLPTCLSTPSPPTPPTYLPTCPPPFPCFNLPADLPLRQPPPIPPLPPLPFHSKPTSPLPLLPLPLPLLLSSFLSRRTRLLQAASSASASSAAARRDFQILQGYYTNQAKKNPPLTQYSFS